MYYRQLPDYLQKAKRVRFLCLAVAFCAAIFIAGAILCFAKIDRWQNIALQQQTAQTSNDAANILNNSKSDAKKFGNRSMYAPKLFSMLGQSFDDALSSLGSGAKIISTTSENNADSAIRTVVVIALANETTGATSETPSVCLALDSEDTVIQAGFSVNLTLLGYGEISFIDAVQNFHVVENTLNETGLTIELNSVHLPPSHSDYAHYTSDGVTLEKDEYIFSGTANQEKKNYSWTASLCFDYTQANTQSNLAYTLRSISVNIIKQH